MFHLVIIYLSLISIAWTAPITPTNETNTTQYYRASLDNNGGNGFQLGNIVCAENKDCKIYCDISNGCQWTDIDAKNANNLYIDCSKISSCSLVNLYGPLSLISSVNIYCTSNKACESAVFTVNNSATVNIICSNGSNTANGACKNAKIYTTNYNNKINISCGAYDCNYVELWTKPFSYNTFLDCIGSESCNNMEINCIKGNGKSILSYSNNSQWECSTDYCCPIISKEDIICLYNLTGPFCSINCTSDYNCMNTYIDGTNTINPLIRMNVFCNGNNYCQSSKIICPNGANCNIECTGLESCKNTLIDASLSNSLTLICGENGCESSYILCPFNENSCSIECRGLPYSCYNMQIIQLKNTLNSYLDIMCPTPTTQAQFIDACTSIQFICPLGIINYNPPQIYTDLKTKCIKSMDNLLNNNCCPWPILQTTSLSPTKRPMALIPLTPTVLTPLTSSIASLEKQDNKTKIDLLLYILIIGCILLILSLCILAILWYRKKKKSQPLNTNKTNMPVTTYKTNDKQSLNPTIRPTQSQLEIEKSVEMQSTSGQTITDFSNVTSRKMGGGGGQRNISNPPQNNRQQLGLADLGNSGWDD